VLEPGLFKSFQQIGISLSELGDDPLVEELGHKLWVALSDAVGQIGRRCVLSVKATDYPVSLAVKF
jgi:hypothetical protein